MKCVSSLLRSGAESESWPGLAWVSCTLGLLVVHGSLAWAVESTPDKPSGQPAESVEQRTESNVVAQPNAVRVQALDTRSSRRAWTPTIQAALYNAQDVAPAGLRPTSALDAAESLPRSREGIQFYVGDGRNEANGSSSADLPGSPAAPALAPTQTASPRTVAVPARLRVEDEPTLAVPPVAKAPLTLPPQLVAPLTIPSPRELPRERELPSPEVGTSPAPEITWRSNDGRQETPARREQPSPIPAVVAPSVQRTADLSNRSGLRVATTAFQPADKMPDDAPFEVIEQSGELVLQARRSKLLRTKNNVYRTAVVDPQICDVLQFTPREMSIIGRAQGATHVTFWFEGEDQKPLTYLVRVVPDADELKRAEVEYQLLEDMLADLFPNSKVRLVVMADKLIVKGQAKDSEEASQIMTVVRNQAGSRVYNRSNGAGAGLSSGFAAEVIDDEASGRNRQQQRMQVINMLRVPGVQQVALKVKIAELNRTAVRGFGLDVDGIVNFSDNPEGSAMFLQSMINVATGDTPALLTQFDGDDIRFGIRWLQQRGVLRLLSEPTLVTMSGRPATFVAGGEFAVPTVVGSVGLNAVTTDFRAFGVIISFMPIVLDKDRIRLEVAPEFSQINNQLEVGQTPGLNVRAVTTTVEMREGQTLAIAGLLEDTMAANSVGNLPLLSQIFGRRDITRSETELIILVTPELVQAMEPEEVPPLPGFDVTEPNNKEFFLGGHLEGNPTREYRSTVWPRLKKRYGSGGPSMISGPFGHGQ